MRRTVFAAPGVSARQLCGMLSDERRPLVLIGPQLRCVHITPFCDPSDWRPFYVDAVSAGAILCGAGRSLGRSVRSRVREMVRDACCEQASRLTSN
jgi:hypothetical protein